MDDKQLLRELREDVNSQKKIIVEQLVRIFGAPKSITSTPPIHKLHLKDFYVVGEFINPTISNNYLIGNKENNINFITIDTESNAQLHGGVRGAVSKTYHFSDSFSICAFNTTLNLGRTYIRKEKFTDKVLELFNPLEVDFNEYPEFSSRYFCLTNNPDLLKNNINKDIIDLFENYYGDITVEFHENICAVKSKYSIRQKTRTMRVVEFALKLQQLTNKNVL